MQQQSRTWAFTLNHYTEDELERIEEFFEAGSIKYLVYGKEVGEAGTPHLQGTINFHSPTRLSLLKRVLGRAHWEQCRNPIASYAYCKKDDDFTEFGEIPRHQKGKRTDLEKATEFLLESKDLVLFRQTFPVHWVKYPRGFGSLLDFPGREPGLPPIVEWLHGPTGTGKTRQVIEKEPSLWISAEDLRWFDGYEGQPAVLFDDFRADFCKFHTLLRYLDRYPVRVPIKGGFVNFAPARIYITSCGPPRSMYNKSDEDVQQLLRRITTVTHIPFPLYL